MMKIQCPECDTKLTLGQQKPGKYRPKCKHCGKPFVVKVTGDDPPKAVVSHYQKKTADQTHPNTNATMDQSVESVPVEPADSSASIVRQGKNVLKKRSKQAAEDQELAPIPERLGGYKILRVLGRGAMGSVYEAKQISLDRNVALKTIRGRLSQNPASLARFTREAYAAAQLNHHNVVQIYDFGEDDGKHFFSMEWVRGGPLTDMVRDKGAIEPKLAAGYTLQAARGLQFAHQHGMVHRDVKPANLLLSDEGVVKVADLGLVKIPDLMDPDSDVGVSSMSGMHSGTQVTMMGTAVGTPAYMAPEQGIDAASVDHRADIYSLGCSLFFLLIGRPPFDGSVVSEVLEQHAKQSPPDLVALDSRIPAPLNQIVQRSMAKQPKDRYASLADMIGDLESYLGVSTDGSFSPSSGQADEWEAIAKRYTKATPLSRLSSPVFVAFTLVCGLLTLVLPFVGLRWLMMTPAMFVTGILTAVVLGGGRSAVGVSIRKWISSLGLFDYVVAVFGFLSILLVAFLMGSWLGLIVGVILGVGAGAGYHFGLVMPTRIAASEPQRNAEKFIRNLRIDGADEDGLRSFAARYGGESWQPLFEALFGYESLCEIRDRLGSDSTFSNNTEGGFRDKVIAKFLSKAESSQQARDHQRLAKIEEQALASQGMSAADAKKQAWQMAQKIIANAHVGSEQNMDAALAVQMKRERQKDMLAEARSGKHAMKREKYALLKFALGGQTRLLAGIALLTIFAVWGQANGLFQQIQADGVSLETLQGLSVADKFGACVGSLGLAGLLLCMSSFVSGWRMSPFATIATVVILFGPAIGVPAAGPLAAWIVAGAVGIAIYVPGIIWGDNKEF